MTQEQKPTPVRKKLTVISLGEKITLQSGAVKYPFVATNDKGEKHDYATFSKSLAEYLKPGSLDADVVTEEKGNFINRTVKMVYVDGKPVAGASAKGWQRDPPEPPDQKRRSYALSYAKDLAVGSVINRDEIMSWAQKFDTFLSGQQASGSSVVPTPKTEPKNSGGTALQKPTPGTVKAEPESTGDQPQSDKDIVELFPEPKPLDLKVLASRIAAKNQTQSGWILATATRLNIKPLNRLDAFIGSMTAEQKATIQQEV